MAEKEFKLQKLLWS